jgi:hypothetical protein
VFTSSNKVGTTTVTATANGISARSTVTVAKRPAH